MAEIELHGPANSSFVCAARVALEEKGVLYHLIEPDILRASGFRLADLLRYLAAQQPRLVEGDFALFDCDSILRYVDEAFAGPALQPADPKPRAMMVEIQGIVREYLYPAAIGKIATQRLFAPFLGSPTDTRTIDEAVQPMTDALAAIEQLSLAAHDGEKSELRGALTKKTYQRIGDLLRERFGPMAGWAQQYLFYGDIYSSGAWTSYTDQTRYTPEPTKPLRP